VGDFETFDSDVNFIQLSNGIYVLYTKLDTILDLVYVLVIIKMVMYRKTFKIFFKLLIIEKFLMYFSLIHDW